MKNLKTMIVMYRRLILPCMYSGILIIVFSFQSHYLFSQKRTNTAQYKYSNENLPVLKWTANRDSMNFRYDFLENIEHIKLYEATLENGTFSHHQHITLHDGIVYAVWDSHIRDENAAGQHAKMRRSNDGGKIWTPIEELFHPCAKNVPADSEYGETRFQTINGFAVVNGTLYAIADVAEWSRADAMKIRPRVKVGQMCRAILPDGGLGDIFWLQDQAPEPVESFPSYPAGDPVLIKKIFDYFSVPGQEIQLSFGGPGHPASDDNHGMGEPVPSYQLEDGTWVRLYRDGGSKTAKNRKEEEFTKSRRNYASFSFDNGASWTVPTRTSFPDACARTNAGKLPDGQVYVINNVLPLSTKKGGRSLLAISLSRDGLNFDRLAVIRFLPPPQRFKGRAKSVGFAYPHSVVVGDHLLVIHSVNKEDIELTRIPINVLPD